MDGYGIEDVPQDQFKRELLTCAYRDKALEFEVAAFAICCRETNEKKYNFVFLSLYYGSCRRILESVTVSTEYIDN